MTGSGAGSWPNRLTAEGPHPGAYKSYDFRNCRCAVYMAPVSGPFDIPPCQQRRSANVVSRADTQDRSLHLRERATVGDGRSKKARSVAMARSAGRAVAGIPLEEPTSFELVLLGTPAPRSARWRSCLAFLAWHDALRATIGQETGGYSGLTRRQAQRVSRWGNVGSERAALRSAVRPSQRSSRAR